MSNPRQGPDEFDEEELIRSEFDSIVSGLSLDESTPTTYLDELDKFDSDHFIAPNPPRQSAREIFFRAKSAIKAWFNRPNHDDEGTRI